MWPFLLVANTDVELYTWSAMLHGLVTPKPGTLGSSAVM